MQIRRSLAVLACLVAAQSARAQGPSANAAARKTFDEVSAWVTKSAEMVPADKYSFKATPAVRSFGEIVAHVADAYNFYCANAAGTKTQWSDAIEKANLDKAVIVAKLGEALAVCNKAYAGNTGRIDILIENAGHTNLHYGNLITYLRLMGMTPPSS